MTSRTVLSAIAVCAVLAPLAGCGGGGEGGADDESSPSAGGLPSAPAESRAPSKGKGSKDPDDINGDGYRDLVVPVTGREQFAVLYGSSKGLDASTRTVYGRRDLGLPEPSEEGVGGKKALAPDAVADLDGDGFPDFVTTVMGERASDGPLTTARSAPYVTWGGPGGPTAGDGASAVRLPSGAAKLGLESVVRGDFDGDGHHDLGGVAVNGSSLVVLYGPFTRSGVPDRTDTSLSLSDGDLIVDAIDPSGKPRATSLLFQETNDGEQSGNVFHRARRGTGLSADGRRLRVGSAHAFGDFDGDGQRDVAVGDDGGRNNEPGHTTEAPEVDGSLDVYPGSGGEPVKHQLPEVPKGRGTDYGPGGFVAADPDGDGRDGLLVATYEGATLIDGDQRTAVKRNVRKGPARWRHARPAGAADFDGDGKDELMLHWGPGTLFGLYGEDPTHWWITDGTTSRDKASFAAKGLARGAS